MKKALTLLTLLMSFVTLSCQQKLDKNDLEKENLKGNVLSVRETDYYVTEKFGEPVKGARKCVDLDICELYTKYNELGNKTEFSEYNSYGISFISKIKYNEKNQKIEQNRYTPEEGKRVMQFKLKYDSKGNCTEIRSDYGYVEKKVYDENNNLIKETITHNLSETFQYTYKYNDKNQKIIELYESGKTQYTYFEDGNIKDVIVYNNDGSIQRKGNYTYQYDDHQNWIVQIGYEDGVPIFYLERIIEYKN
ncbi:hypothetical protein [Flavobacterium sp.]|jgi:hypothetical protein|uniref:hypothetical protein n=1 Tax=Flavobacterium sp. TaxID=239 RepID=UPI00286ECAF8|nr:hypothetical protein [Flavobacterium sp.]